MKQKIIIILFMCVSSTVFSQDLVYRPFSPFFGGDTFNYQQILAAANAQNDFTENENQQEPRSELEQFTESLNRRLLSSLSQSLFQQQLGNTNLTVGTYSFGDLVVEITPGSNGLNVSILNTQTGEQTEIILPNNG